jgi:hypothetical protein
MYEKQLQVKSTIKRHSTQYHDLVKFYPPQKR